MGKSFNIQATEITPGIRLSSAAVHYDEMWGERWQYETWIFASHTIPSRQTIHGSASAPNRRLEDIAKKYHRRIVSKLKRNQPNDQ